MVTKPASAKDMEDTLNQAEWSRQPNNLWYDPDRPNIGMSLRTAYYTQLKKVEHGGKRSVIISK